MNTKHIILDIEDENVGGAYCIYCGEKLHAAYNEHENAYEFRCSCSFALKELQLSRAIQEAQSALEEFFAATEALTTKKTLEIKKDTYMQYALQLKDMYNDYILYEEKEKRNE